MLHCLHFGRHLPQTATTLEQRQSTSCRELIAFKLNFSETTGVEADWVRCGAKMPLQCVTCLSINNSHSIRRQQFLWSLTQPYSYTNFPTRYDLATECTKSIHSPHDAVTQITDRSEDRIWLCNTVTRRARGHGTPPYTFFRTQILNASTVARVQSHPRT